MHPGYLLTLAATLAAAPFAYGHVNGDPYGTPKAYCELPFPGDTSTHDYGAPATGLFVAAPTDGASAFICFPPNFGDWHQEFAIGGAWLASCSEACMSIHGSEGSGAGACWDTSADHPEYPDVWVFDHALSAAGLAVSFTVAADYLDNVGGSGGELACGDTESDYHVDCVDHCTVPFPPGLDGTYEVYVTGTQGHVWTP